VGDRVKIILEELWAGGAFKGFGNILAAEVINNGRPFRAYRFDDGEGSAYFDADGKSLQKTLLRSPLKFRYISSHFSKRRFHPILRKYRPHLGVDYAAPSGTPVSAAGGGTVLFAGYKGQNGKMVRIKHRGGYQTYYGHLSRIPRKIRKGRKVSQGDIIGYVGSTGLSTGPHLDYRMKLNGRFVNPLKVRLPREESVPKALLAQYRQFTGSIDEKFALLGPHMLASSMKNGVATDDDS
jgi:murein DD-endopeptidase MepM/ murein hydrolase activator NlpD